jgi:hypothetical protein
MYTSKTKLPDELLWVKSVVIKKQTNEQIKTF